VVERVKCTQVFHADNLSSDVLSELKADGHLTALAEWALSTHQDHIKHVLFLVVCNFELKFFVSQLCNIKMRNKSYLWPSVHHELFDLDCLNFVWKRKVAQLPVILTRHVEVKVVKVKNVLRGLLLLLRSHNAGLGFIWYFFYFQNVYEGVLENFVAPAKRLNFLLLFIERIVH